MHEINREPSSRSVHTKTITRPLNQRWPRETHPALLSVIFTSILAREHGLVKRSVAIGEINMMFSKIRFALDRIETL